MLDIDIFMKLAPASVATALASIVFPVPGGPNKRIPLHGCNLTANIRPQSLQLHSSLDIYSHNIRKHKPKNVNKLIKKKIETKDNYQRLKRLLTKKH